MQQPTLLDIIFDIECGNYSKVLATLDSVKFSKDEYQKIANSANSRSQKADPTEMVQKEKLKDIQSRAYRLKAKPLQIKVDKIIDEELEPAPVPIFEAKYTGQGPQVEMITKQVMEVQIPVKLQEVLSKLFNVAFIICATYGAVQTGIFLLSNYWEQLALPLVMLLCVTSFVFWAYSRNGAISHEYTNGRGSFDPDSETGITIKHSVQAGRLLFSIPKKLVNMAADEVIRVTNLQTGSTVEVAKENSYFKKTKASAAYSEIRLLLAGFYVDAFEIHQLGERILQTLILEDNLF